MADIREDGADAPTDIFLAQRVLALLALAQLVVHAPDIVRLFVDQHRAAGIAAGIEEGAPLGREIVIHPDVGDHVAALRSSRPSAAGRASERIGERAPSAART